MWQLDYKESLVPENWCFWNVMLKETLESPLDCKEIQPVHPKGNRSWIFIARTDVEAKIPTVWPPDVKNWLFGKDPDAGKDWGGRRRGWQKMRSLDVITDLMDMNLSSGSWWWTWKSGVLQSMGLQRVGHDWATELNGLCWDHVQHLTRLILFRLSLHPKPCPSKQGFLLSFPSSLVLPPFYLGDGGVGSVSHWFAPPSEQCVCPLLSRVWLFATPWTVAHQSPLSVGFPRQEYWSGLPFPSPRNLLCPGMKP